MRDGKNNNGAILYIGIAIVAVALFGAAYFIFGSRDSMPGPIATRPTRPVSGDCSLGSGVPEGVVIPEGWAYRINSDECFSYMYKDDAEIDAGETVFKSGTVPGELSYSLEFIEVVDGYSTQLYSPPGIQGVGDAAVSEVAVDGNRIAGVDNNSYIADEYVWNCGGSPYDCSERVGLILSNAGDRKIWVIMHSAAGLNDEGKDEVFRIMVGSVRIP